MGNNLRSQPIDEICYDNCNKSDAKPIQKILTLHDAVDDVPRVLLHLPQHHEVRHDGVREEREEQKHEQEENDEAG